MKKLGAVLVCVGFCLPLPAAQLPVTLGSTVTFSILAAAMVTNSGPTVVNGNVGISPGLLSQVTGFPPGTVAPGFAIYATTPGPAATAQIDLTAAYNDAATSHRDGDVPTTLSGDLSGLTLAPGLYNSTSTLSLGQTGSGILIFSGSANSVWVIQVGSGLNTFTGSQMILAGGAQASNIFWQVGSSATLGTNSIFYGTILAQASISLGTGAVLDGRALARTGAVTLLSNTMTEPGPSGGPAGALAVTCPNSSAQVGLTYNSLVVATGGTPPYTYSIPPGTLPPGLSLNTTTGAVTGTPSLLGSNNFTATATDSAAGSANNSCSITTTNQPATVPAPASLSLVLIGLACAMLYRSRERIMRVLKRS